MSYTLDNDFTIQKSQWITIGLSVIGIHLCLLFFGRLWSPLPPPSKKLAKVVVQTISLSPIQSPNRQAIQVKPKESESIKPLQNDLELQASISKVVSDNKQNLVQEVPVKKDQKVELENSSLLALEIPLKDSYHQQPEKHVFPHSPPAAKKVSPKPSLKPQESVKNDIPKPTAPIKKAINPPNKEIKNQNLKNNAAENRIKKEKQEADNKRQQELKEAENKKRRELEAKQEAARKHEKELLNKAKEKLAKIGDTRDKISSSSTTIKSADLPHELGGLHIDALPIDDLGTDGSWGSNEISYGDEVAARLKMALRLPDYGAVKIKLTLDRKGKVVTIETVQTESQKNKSYVESKIPNLLFPAFGQRFQNVAQNTFEITLKNDS